jgi:CSLREA domain-containing protein
MRSRTVSLVLAAVLHSVGEAHAAKRPDLVVNEASDDDDGACTPEPTGCTLREAINAVNAGPERSIGFDPAIFPLGAGTAIIASPALPVVQRSGVSIDGAGAGVRLSGAGTVVAPGLDFSTTGGAELSGIRVANLVIDGFGDFAVRICSGSPACTGPLARVEVENVSIFGTSGGIRVAGSEVKDVSVLGSVVSENGDAGITVAATANLTGVAIERSSVSQGGILLLAGMTLTGAVVSANTVSGAPQEGILLDGALGVVKPRIFGNHVDGSGNFGISIVSNGDILAPRIERNTATNGANDGIGAVAGTGRGVLGGRIAENVAFGNFGAGISIFRVSRALVSANRVNRNTAGLALGGAGEGNRVRANEALGNADVGIGLNSGQLANRVIGNRALGNGGVDLFDGNPDCGTNRWSRNVARIAMPLCALVAP